MTDQELSERMERLWTMLDKPELDEQYRRELLILIDSVMPNVEYPTLGKGVDRG
jgi:hypothetical protein